MADRATGIKVNVKKGDTAGLKDIEREGQRVGGGLKKAIGGALADGMKGGQEAVKGLLSDLKGVVGTVGGLMGGLGLAELVKGALEANSKFGDLAAGIKFAGGNARDAAAAQRQAQASALAWAQDSMQVVDAFEAMRGETGSIEFAQKSIDTVSEAARGAHKDLSAMAAVSGTLNEKFGITAEELPDALADVVGLSEKGGVGFEDMASKLGLIGAYAKEAGLEGREGFGQMIGLLNMADNANGNFKKGLTGVGALLEQLGSSGGKNKIAAALGISGGALKGNAVSQIEAIMKATKGQKGQLEKAFGGETLKLLVDMGKTYAAAFDSTKGSVKEKGEAAAAALRASVGDASKSAVTWADIQNEAAAEMREAPQKVATATEMLRQAMQSERMQAAIAKIIAKLPALAEFFANIASWTVDNPGTAITAAIVGSIGKAAIGETVGSLLGSFFKSFPGATVGVGLLAAAAVAAAEAIADYEKKSKKTEEELDQTPDLIKKAQKEIATTGQASPETLDELARRRADFEAVKKATETGGQEFMSFASILTAKVTGGADELAVGEGITNEAKKLGAEGVDTTIADLDAVIAQAVAARRGQGAGAPTPAVPAPSAGGAAPPVPAAAAPSGAAFDPQLLAQMMATGVSSKELKVRVVNPQEIAGGGGPTGAGPATPGWKPR